MDPTKPSSPRFGHIKHAPSRVQQQPGRHAISPAHPVPAVIPVRAGGPAVSISVAGAQRRDGDGKAAPGPVVFIKQRHAFTGSAQERPLVIKWQKQVLDELFIAKPDAVFSEGVYDGYKPRESQRAIMQAVFKDYAPLGKPTPEQEDALAGTSAARIYTRIHPDVELCATNSPAVGAAVECYVEKHHDRMVKYGMNPHDREVIFDRRESEAASRLLDWRQKNPGKKAALVFGRGHGFARLKSQLGDLLSVIDPGEAVRGDGQPDSKAKSS